MSPKKVPINVTRCYLCTRVLGISFSGSMVSDLYCSFCFRIVADCLACLSDNRSTVDQDVVDAIFKHELEAFWEAGKFRQIVFRLMRIGFDEAEWERWQSRHEQAGSE